MKILFVIPTMGCGGAEILIGAIARNLFKKGHEVHIVCLLEHHETWPNYPDREQLLSEIPLRIIGGSVTFRFLKSPEIDNQAFVNYVNDFQPNVIHSHLYISELLSRSVIFPGIRYFSHGHDNMPQLKKLNLQTFSSKTNLANLWERHWLLKRYAKCNNQFIAISEDVKKYLSKNVSAFQNHIHYIPNAIDVSRFRTSRNYSPASGLFHIVSIANLVPKKNHILLVDVMDVLTKKGYNITMEVLGAGPLMEMLQQKIREKNLENRLFFRGSVGDVPERLRNANLYVHPAWYEPFGLVLLEAMASGLPVVSLDGFGNRELMKEGQNGFMLPATASAEDFADKIIHFIDHPEEIERMGKFAAAFSDNYDIDHYTDRLLEVYSNDF